MFTKESVGKAKVHSQQIESLERDLEGHQEKAFDISRLIIDIYKVIQGHESQKMSALMILVIGFFKEQTDSIFY